MDKRVMDKIKELRVLLQETMPEDTVRVDLYITGTEYGMSLEQKTVDDLKREMTSMRNLRGQFIK